MVTKVTHGIKVSVNTTYLEKHSNPDMFSYLFSYTIKIENNSEYSVQLLGRHWRIFDSCEGNREVKGNGVVGLQPVIAPGEFYEYESACDLSTDIGSMHGTYLMLREADNKKFSVNIPRFELIVPRRLN